MNRLDLITIENSALQFSVSEIVLLLYKARLISGSWISRSSSHSLMPLVNLEMVCKCERLESGGREFLAGEGVGALAGVRQPGGWHGSRVLAPLSGKWSLPQRRDRRPAPR